MSWIGAFVPSLDLLADGYPCLYKYSMCLYEQRPFSNAHEMGLISLLKSRKRRAFQDTLSSRVLSATRHQIVRTTVATLYDIFYSRDLYRFPGLPVH